MPRLAWPGTGIAAEPECEEHGNSPLPGSERVQNADSLRIALTMHPVHGEFS